MLTALSIKEYLAKTASGDPVPGGGSSAAFNAALGAALTEMVANLTIGRRGFEAVAADMRSVAHQASVLRAKLLLDVDRDSDAYARVLAAFRLPKATEADNAVRTKAVQHAFQQAALVPLGVARDALAVMDLGGFVIAKGNPNAASDGAAGVLAAHMAARTAVYNVRINLGSIRDKRFCAELQQEADRIETEAEAKATEILHLVKLK